MEIMDTIEELAGLFKALSDPTRLRLIKLLSEGQSLCVNALTQRSGVSQSAVSQHLRILRHIGLVTGDRRGYHIHYSLNQELVKQYREKLKKTLGENFVMDK
jgi:DNA-binding transcriptional ArsR family regulator